MATRTALPRGTSDPSRAAGGRGTEARRRPSTATEKYGAEFHLVRLIPQGYSSGIRVTKLARLVAIGTALLALGGGALFGLSHARHTRHARGDTFILVTGRRQPLIYAIDLGKALDPRNDGTPNAIVSRAKTALDR